MSSRPKPKPTIAFDELLLSIAKGARDSDTLSSAAHQLARLDRNLTEADRDQIRELTGGLPLKQIAANLLHATDPNHRRSGVPPLSNNKRLMACPSI